MSIDRVVYKFVLVSIIFGSLGTQANAQYGQPPAANPYGQPQQAPQGGQYGQPPPGNPYGQPSQGGQYGQPQQAPRGMQPQMQAPAASSTLDRTLRPVEGEDVNAIFENVVAVQRKAKIKAKKQIFNPYLSVDFSDAPNTMYGTAINYGYAVSEFWEIYANVIPQFITNERTIAKKVRELKVYDRSGAPLVPDIAAEKAKFFMGVEVNYVPIYGKDSWGPYGIVRSDTFMNIGLGMIQYESGSGLRTKLALGKTWFISDWFNVRLQAGGSILEAIYQKEKEMTVIGLIEGGLVFYF
jgi:outer membrane beta-barrel protein